MARWLPPPLTELSPAEFARERMVRFGGRARDLVPGPFDAYARVFHRPDQGMPELDIEPSWAAVARARGTTFHKAAQWDYLAGWVGDSRGVGGDRSRDVQPLIGSLDRHTLALLCGLLGKHTSTPGACWLALWAGFGQSPAEWRQAPTFRTPGREYWLFESSLDRVVEFSVAFGTSGLAADDPWLNHELESGHVQSPQLWWPDDQAWAVASEIDYDSTIVAGTEKLIDELLRMPEIECLRVSEDTSLYYDADTLNRRTM